MQPDIAVFQIYFNEETKSFLDAGFIPYLSHKKDGYAENTVIKNMYESLKKNTDFNPKYIGISSYEQKSKTGIASQEILNHIQEQITQGQRKDVYIYSPISNVELTYDGVIPAPYGANGIIKEPNIWDKHKKVFQKSDLDTLLNNSDILPFKILDGNWAYCTSNYWIVTREVFDAYCEKVLIPVCSWLERPEIKRITRYTEYIQTPDDKVHPLFSSLFEGLFGSFIAHSSYSYSYIYNKKINRRVIRKVNIIGYDSGSGIRKVNSSTIQSNIPISTKNSAPSIPQSYVAPNQSISNIPAKQGISVNGVPKSPIYTDYSLKPLPSYAAIILNWNESHVSEESIRLLLQDNIQVIVVDNGSTDNSVEKFKNFGDKIQVVSLNKNYGSSVARNIGIGFSESEFTFLLDGDIEYVPGTISKYAQVLRHFPDCACVGYFDHERRLKEGWTHGTKHKNNAEKKIGKIGKIGTWYPMAWTQYGLFRTSVLKKYMFVTIPPFNAAGYGFEDDWLFHEFRKDGWTSLSVNTPYYYHDAHFSLRELKKTNVDNQVDQRKQLFEKFWGVNALSEDTIKKIKENYIQYEDTIREVDVVMLSFTSDEAYYRMTQDAIISLHNSEKNIVFNVHLVETNPDYKRFGVYTGCSVIVPNEKFNYNRFVNIGLSECRSEYIMVTNNDVLFAFNWFSIMRNTMENMNADSACPFWREWFAAEADKIPDVWEGYEVGKQVFGYCMIMKRAVLERLGQLDEKFEFWFQDNDLSSLLKKNGFKHILIKNSVVHHLGAKSHSLIPKHEYDQKTNGMKKIFDEKWKVQSF